MKKKIEFQDIIDIEFLQKFQDYFAKSVNMASFATYNSGGHTKPSNFTRFCSEFNRSNELGCTGCNKSDARWALTAAKEGKPVIYQCHAGLTDFAVPIIVAGNHVGTIFGGQVITKPIDEALLIKNAKKFGLDEQEYIKAAKELNIVSLDKVKAASDLLYIVANAISEIGHKNLQLIEKHENELLCQNVMNMIRNSVDIDKTKQKIVEIVGETLNGDRCLILDYDPKNDNFKLIDNEYLSPRVKLSMLGRDPNRSVPNFAEMLKEGVPILIQDRVIYKQGVAQTFEIETEIIQKYDIDSSLIYPLFYKDELLGAIAIHYVNKYHPILEDEVYLLSVLANQIAIAIHQSMLYEALNKITANQKAILNNIPFMAWLKDEKSKFLAVNEEFAKTCGVLAENVIGKTDFDFFPEAHAEEYLGRDLDVLKSGRATSLEEIINSVKGPRYHETFKTPVFDEHGKVIGTAGLARDITERKEIELELLKKNEQISKAAEREKLLREMISEISSTLDSNEIRKILVTKLGEALNSDLDIIYIRDPKTDRFQVLDEYSIHRSSPDIKNPVGINVIEDYGFDYYIRQNEKVEVVYSDIEDLKSHYDVYGKPPAQFFDEYGVKSIIIMPIMYAGKFLGLLVMNFIKEHRTFSEDDFNLVKIVANQASIALYQSRLYIQAQEASRVKSEFIANMSHEIKTPLNIIIGFSDLMAQAELDSEKQLKYLDNINKSGKHLLNLTNDIINISKIEAGILDVNYETIKIKELAFDVVESIRIMAKNKNINLNMDIENIIFQADRKMLIQVLYNLLNNAIKFTNENGKIDISAKKKGENIVISVKDNGIGVALKNQGLIFENFKQLDSSVERAQQGAGLGLAITKKLIEMHNGNIHVESKEGEGSNFWFTIPL